MRDFRFTNVSREHDRVTAWLRRHWTQPNLDAPVEVVLLNCALFRGFGTVAMAESVGWTASIEEFSSASVIQAAERVWHSDRHAYTRAYTRPHFNSERRKAFPSLPPTDVYSKSAQRLEGLVAAPHSAEI